MAPLFSVFALITRGGSFSGWTSPLPFFLGQLKCLRPIFFFNDISYPIFFRPPSPPPSLTIFLRFFPWYFLWLFSFFKTNIFSLSPRGTLFFFPVERSIRPFSFLSPPRWDPMEASLIRKGSDRLFFYFDVEAPCPGLHLPQVPRRSAFPLFTFAPAELVHYPRIRP